MRRSKDRFLKDRLEKLGYGPLTEEIRLPVCLPERTDAEGAEKLLHTPLGQLAAETVGRILHGK